MRNKTHKSRHASKHEVARRAAAGGRAVADARFNVPTAKPVGKGGVDPDIKNRTAQAAAALRKLKQQAVDAKKAIGSISRGGPPRIVTFAAINESASPQAAQAVLYAHCGAAPPADDERPNHVCSAKHRYTTVLVPELDEQRILDAVKVSDVMVLCLDCSSAVQSTIKELNTEQPPMPDHMSDYSGTTWFADIGLCITDTTRELIRAVNSHGCPTVVVLLQNLETYDTDKKRRHVLRIHERYFESMMAEGTKVLALDGDADGGAAQLERTLGNVKLRELAWREQHPYMLVDERHYDPATGALEVRGFLRGMHASASMLWHLTNYDTYQATQISAPGDPTRDNSNDFFGELDVADPDVQETLVGIQQNETAYREHDELPTEADVAYAEQQAAAAAAAGAGGKRTVWVPEGVSAYQASWYDNADDEENAAHAAANPQPHPPQQHHHNGAAAGGNGGLPPAGGFDTRSAGGSSAQTDAVLLRAAEVMRHEQLTDEERLAERERVIEECEDEERHADEVDTPYDVPARQRFAKYRAMKSFATSSWDSKENLPIEFASIFELSGYARIRTDSIAEAEQAPVPSGSYISIRLENVPAAAVACPILICSAQLRHEQKWSVVHCHVQRSAEYEEPIKSKTPMLAHIGFRKFYCEPIYSDAVVGNRSKFARFFLPGERFRIATFYAPITYHPSPVMMYEAPSMQQVRERAPLRLTMFGSVLPPNPNFLVLKRVVLTGRIATIYKKVLVVKFMFFNEDDVKWFQPVDLWTRLGRQGRIIKAVGTHGMFKASFNDTVFQHDAIHMTLWKRVFPKWRTLVFNEATMQGDDGEQNDEAVDSDDADA